MSQFKLSETFIRSSFNPKYKLFIRSWKLINQAPKAILLMQHGYTFHSAYFQPFASKLCEQGIEVLAMDLVGHGKSDSVNQVRGYVHSFNQYVQDLANFVKEYQLKAEKNYGKCPPIFLYGESMGGTIVMEVVRTDNLNLSGLILLAPVIRVNPSLLPPAPILIILKLLAFLFPMMAVPGENKVQEGYAEAFGDQQYAKQALKDSLVNKNKPTIRFAVETIKQCSILEKNLKQFSLPMLVLHGTEDYRADIENSRELMQVATSFDKTFKQYKGGKHQLLQDQETIRVAVQNDILKWLLKRLEKC